MPNVEENERITIERVYPAFSGRSIIKKLKIAVKRWAIVNKTTKWGEEKGDVIAILRP